MIRIVYHTGEEEFVPPKFLDILLYLQQIQLFERNDGWVVVGVDKLRNTNPTLYFGPDMRQHKQTPLPDPIKTHLWPASPAQYQ
jgi:hypothetical protein